MTLALYILLALVGVGGLLWLTDRPSSTPVPDPVPNQEACCGQHEVCEKYPPAPSDIIYYDDEHLDAYSHRQPNSYSDAETDEFRDVMLTLIPSDVYPWTQSLDRRQIALPDSLRDELLILLADA